MYGHLFFAKSRERTFGAEAESRRNDVEAESITTLT
jgi:hypothetical protein